MRNVIDYLIVFGTPLIIFLSQFESILVALTALIIINYVSCIIKEIKSLKGFILIKIIRATFKQNVLDFFFKKAIEFPLVLTSIALFETYFIGGEYVEFLNGNITLSKLALLLIGWREISQISKNVEHITGNNIFETMGKFLPEKLKLFNKKNDL